MIIENQINQAKRLALIQIEELQSAYNDILNGIDPQEHFDKISELREKITELLKE